MTNLDLSDIMYLLDVLRMNEEYWVEQAKERAREAFKADWDDMGCYFDRSTLEHFGVPQ